ncbi:unnamed protein product [Rotaria sp. Silwood1]|nr:unnamed protein product [Rotaria sp. Silwood1]CAF1453198.1 unnamed protein product [Rotaria sp. Silwood1]CAF3476181.1 unnamed protein product [Rotaria sp. Silwood1]CAF4844015.1 unnamed protein product [Rotaria sp. Silwood1]CAF4966060.1 unnamed protein product [Rotaria sp. Silwood1]
MALRILLFLFALCICFTIINSKTQCSCSCCKGNGCFARYQGIISLPTCSSSSCKHTCKMRYPGQCGRSPGTLVATCTKTKKPRRFSSSKKTKSRLRPSSRKNLFGRPSKFGSSSTKHLYRQPY